MAMHSIRQCRNPPTWLAALRKTALVLLFIDMTLLLVEAGLFLLDPLPIWGPYEYEPDLGFRIRPGARDSNRFGFNDRDYPLNREPNTFRVLVLSDSYNWAGGRDGNYTALLERRFQEYFGDSRVEVISAGYPRTQTEQQLGCLRKYGLQYNPDMVLLGFYVGNDFPDAVAPRDICVNGIFIGLRQREWVLLGRPVMACPRLANYIVGKIETRRKLHSVSPMRWRETAYLDVEASHLVFFRRSALKYPCFRRIEKAIQDMAALCAQEGILFRIAIYPDELHADAEYRASVLRKLRLRGMEFPDVEFGLPQTLVKSYARGTPCLDLTSAFTGKDVSLYLPRDGHWNLAGNQLAADELFHWLLPDIEAGLKASKVVTK